MSTRIYAQASLDEIHQLLERLKVVVREFYRMQRTARNILSASEPGEPPFRDFEAIENELSALIKPLLAEFVARESRQDNRIQLYEEWGLHDLFIDFESLDLELLARNWRSH